MRPREGTNRRFEVLRSVRRRSRRAWRRVKQSAKSLTHEERTARKIKSTYETAAESVRTVTGFVVASGPFKGMRYVDRRGHNWAGIMYADSPLLLGSYEAELHEVIEDAVSRSYARVVDIGSAEGYYAIGLALRLPSAEIYAFDSNPVARQLCSKMAQLNGVENRVRIDAEATPERLREVITPGTLVICDCEGCEREVLNPEQIPGLLEADMIIELHDFLDPGVTSTVTERFKASHEIKLVPVVARDHRPYEGLLENTPAWIRPWVVSEFRGGGLEPHHAEWGIFARRSSN